MANNTLKNSPKYQVVNGLKYFKLQSPYPTDYTKNCGLLGNEIDENFFFLRSYDIEDMSIENGILTLKRVDGDTLSADVSSTYTFDFDKKTGQLIITDGNGDKQVLDGFVVEGKDVRVATDATLDGDGTSQNPLRLSETEKTGTYGPANEFLDMAVYDYYIKVCDMPYGEESKSYHYESIDKEDIPEGEDIIEYSEKPTEDITFESPKYIKVREDIELPDPTHLGKGYRIVTRETIDNFGLLYNFDGVEKIKEALDATGSLWRVPTRRDWALMLNAAEYCEDDRNHDTFCVNEWTGKNAGARAKSLNLWKKSNIREHGLPVAGEDNLPNVGEKTFRVYPLGDGDGSRGAQDKDYDIEAFSKRGSFWSSTRTSKDNCNSNIFTRTFGYDTRMVLQESSKPSSRMSLRLVRDYVPGQMNISEVEDILGYSIPCVFISNSETGYNKIWTSINIGFKEPQFSGVTSQEWSAATGMDRGQEVVYYINEWDGLRWIKKQMHEGDSIVLLDGGKDESGKTIYNHEWRIYKYEGSTEPVLVDTAEALKEEFQEEIDELHEEIDNEVSARTQADEALQEQIDAISGLTESIVIVEVEPTSADVFKSYELHINDEKKGVTIDIPKDKTIKEITLGHIGATVDENTGEITDGPAENDEALLIVYQNQYGKYSLVEINLEHFIIEDEFKDGLSVENHVVKVKIDEHSEDFLTVSPDGVKLAGVQDAIDIAKAAEELRAREAEIDLTNKLTTTNVGAGLNFDGTYKGHDSQTESMAYINTATSIDDATVALDLGIQYEKARAEAAENGLTNNLSELSATTENLIDAVDGDVDRLDEKIDTETTRATETEQALDTKIETETSRAEGVEETLDSKIDTEVSNENQRAVAAEQALDTKIETNAENIEILSATVETLSAGTVSEIARVDGKIDNETNRATAAEVAIQSELDETQTGAGLESDGTYHKHNTAGDMGNYIANATSLDNATVLIDEAVKNRENEIIALSAGTESEIERLGNIIAKNEIDSPDGTIVISKESDKTNIDVNYDEKTIVSDANGVLGTGLKIEQIIPVDANVRDAYRLVDKEGTPVDNTIIKIYKSSSLVNVELVTVGGIDYVRITYIDNEGETQFFDLNIQQLIFEAEFKDGLEVNENHEVKVKIDEMSEAFLTVSSNGVKLSGVQDAIDEVGDSLADLSASTISEFELLENTWNTPGSIKHTIDDVFIKSVAVGSAEAANKSLLRYYEDGAEHKYYASNNTVDMEHNGSKLSTVIETINATISALSGGSETVISAMTEKIETISGDVQTLSGELITTKAELQTVSGELVTTKEELQTVSGQLVTLLNNFDNMVYEKVKDIIKATAQETKVTSDDTNETVTIGFAEDAIFGPFANG